MITLEQPRTDPATMRTQVNWLNNADVMRYSEQRHKKHTVGTQFDYIQSFLNHPDNILREIHVANNMVGSISAYVDRSNRTADIGIMIGHGFQGKGYGFAAWKMLGDTLFDNVGIRRIEAGCMATNEPMIKIFRKYGMREEGRRMSHFAFEGSYTDLVLYGRFR